MRAAATRTAGTAGTGTLGAAREAAGRPDEPGLQVRVVVPGTVVALAGRLDVAVAADVRLLLVEAVAAGQGDLVLDLSELVVLDAPGLGVLVGAHRRALRAGRTLVLRDVTDPVARLLFLSRLDRVLRLQSGADAA